MILHLNKSGDFMVQNISVIPCPFSLPSLKVIEMMKMVILKIS